jgi:hypothetical protein
MWSQSRIKPARPIVGVTRSLIALSISGLGLMLGGCSDIYTDRRETLALGADDHVAVNEVAQMVDPWPRYVEKREIASNGERMQGAVERYRTGRTYPPVNVTTSSAAYQQAEQAATSTMNAQTAPAGMSAPAAATK